MPTRSLAVMQLDDVGRPGGFKHAAFQWDGFFQQGEKALVAISAMPAIKRGSATRSFRRRFEYMCGLAEPIDPVSGTFDQCTWGKVVADFAVRDYERHYHSRGDKKLAKMNSVRRAISSSSYRGPMFPRAVVFKFSGPSDKNDRKRPEELNAVQTKPNGKVVLTCTSHRIRSDRVLGLVIWDMRKSREGRVLSFPQIAVKLGLTLPARGNAQSAVQCHRQLFFQAWQFIEQSVNPDINVDITRKI